MNTFTIEFANADNFISAQEWDIVEVDAETREEAIELAKEYVSDQLVQYQDVQEFTLENYMFK